MSAEKITSKMSGFIEMKGEVQKELDQLEKHLSEMDKLRSESIDKIEKRKNELKKLSKIEMVRAEHQKLLLELKTAKGDIEKRRLSMEFMDEAITGLDEQVSAIQAEHDRIAAEIELKKQRLHDKISFYEELNAQIEKLVGLLRNEETLFKMKLDDLENQKEGLKNNPDLTPELLEQALLDLDASIEKLKNEHEAVKNTLAAKLSEEMEPALMQEVLAEIDRKMEYHRSHSKSPEAMARDRDEYYKHELKGHLSAEPIYPDESDMSVPREGSVIIQNADTLEAVLGSKGLVLTDSKRLFTHSGTSIDLSHVIQRGLLDAEAMEKLGLKITESNTVLNKDGGLITLQDALEMGLFKIDLPIMGLHLLDTNLIETPNGREITIDEAITLGYLSTKEAIKMGLLDKNDLESKGLKVTASNRILNQEGQEITVKSAMSMGLLQNALTLTEDNRLLTADGKRLRIEEALSQGLLDIPTAIKIGLIDEQALENAGLFIDYVSGNIIDENGEPIKIADAVEKGFLKKDQPKKLVYTSSGRLLTMDGKEITIKEAVAQGLLDVVEAIDIDLVDRDVLAKKKFIIKDNKILGKYGETITIDQAVKYGLFKKVGIQESVSRPKKHEEEKLMDVVTYEPDEETIKPEEMTVLTYPSHFSTSKTESPIRTESPTATDFPSQILADEEKSKEEETVEEQPSKEKEDEKGLFYGSFVSQISSISTESSELSMFAEADIAYLKNEFGRALTLGLSELVQVQPYDPIHYLAHWLFKYRFNQEIEIAQQKDLEALLAERNKIAAAKEHEDIMAAAQEAVIDAWMRAENIIEGKELMLLNAQGEEEGEFDEQDYLNAV